MPLSGSVIPATKYTYRQKLVLRGSRRRISGRFVATKYTLQDASLTSWQKSYLMTDVRSIKTIRNQAWEEAAERCLMNSFFNITYRNPVEGMSALIIFRLVLFFQPGEEVVDAGTADD